MPIDVGRSENIALLNEKIAKLDRDIDWKSAIAHGLFNGTVIGLTFVAGGPILGAIIWGGMSVAEILEVSNNRRARQIYYDLLYARKPTTRGDLDQKIMKMFDEGVNH